MTVLVYNEANVHRQAMTRAVNEARRIFDAAGIVLVVTYDDTTSPDLWMKVRFLFPFGGTQKSSDVMGAAPFDKDGPGRTAYAFWKPIFDLAAAELADEGLILGHVIAHELGHLLLGGAHSAGIMKQGWDTNHVIDAKNGRLLFTSEQAGRMQATLRR